MGDVTVGMAASHALTLEEPSAWDKMRLRNRQSYERRYGTFPVEQPGTAAETDKNVTERYANVRNALEALRTTLAQEALEALVLIGDDQDENFVTTLPQFAIYTGTDFVVGNADTPARIRTHQPLAAAILTRCVESGIDMTAIVKLPEDRLLAHAFGPLLRVIDPDGTLPVVPVFVNSIHVPAPSPKRCLAVGQTIREAVRGFAGVGRVAVFGSGGLSHFTAGYPWKHYAGPMSYGGIDIAFDRWIVERLSAGEGHTLAALTSADLLAHGEIELRSWIVALGALGEAPRLELVRYEPFYRGLMGMGIASWRAGRNA